MDVIERRHHHFIESNLFSIDIAETLLYWYETTITDTNTLIGNYLEIVV
jgi:hypothetical protein